MYKLKCLLSHSGRGFHILGKTKEKVVALMNRIEHSSGSQTILYLLSILQEVAESDEVEEISSEVFAQSLNPKDSDRLKSVYEYVMNHFDEDLNLHKAAAIANMTPNAFSRYFKSRTRKSFTVVVPYSGLKSISICNRLIISNTYRRVFHFISNSDQLPKV
jgi:AraC-like DNA-binding protein